MINPTLIPRNPPAVLCLFAATARTGQRVSSPPTWNTFAAGVFSCYFLLQVNPRVAVLYRQAAFFFFLSFFLYRCAGPQPLCRSQHKRLPVEVIDKRLAFPALQRGCFQTKGHSAKLHLHSHTLISSLTETLHGPQNGLKHEGKLKG